MQCKMQCLHNLDACGSMIIEKVTVKWRTTKKVICHSNILRINFQIIYVHQRNTINILDWNTIYSSDNMTKYVNRTVIRRDNWKNKSDPYECSHTSSSTSACTSTSEFDNEDIDFITTSSSVLKLGDDITYDNSNGDSSTNDTDDDCNSIVSHLSTLSVQRNTHSVDAIDGVVVSVVDDDDDDDESFATLEDDSDIEGDGNSSIQFCPSDEEDDDYNEKSNKTLPKPSYDVLTQQQYDVSNDKNVQIDNDAIHHNEQSILHRPKTLPGLNNNFKVVCVSFMEYNIATSVACTILDEAIRMLRSGGILYVIDKGGRTVKKHPMMRQWLTNVRDPTVKHLIYEIETRAILQCNGFVHTASSSSSSSDGTNDDDDIVRWIGMKS